MSAVFNIRFPGLVVTVTALLAMTGCAINAPAYQPSIDNVGVLKQAGSATVSLGEFKVQSGAIGATAISLRAASMVPPNGGDYAGYLADALKTELDLARRLDPKAKIEITGVLLKNDISAGGLVRNSGEIEARFVVRRDGQVRFDKVVRGATDWEGSLLGSIAIPRAQQQYPMLVQRLLQSLYNDAQFQSAIR